MNGKAITGVIVVALIAGGVWWYVSSADTQGTPAEQTASLPAAEETPRTGTSINPQSANVTVTYTDKGFSPASVTIPLGATVTFVNQSSSGMWVGADEHPSHMEYDGTSRSQHCAAGYSGPTPFDECKSESKGASYSFTFTKAGSFDYHNHVSAGDGGTVTVTSGAAADGSVNAAL